MCEQCVNSIFCPLHSNFTVHVQKKKAWKCSLVSATFNPKQTLTISHTFQMNMFRGTIYRADGAEYMGSVWIELIVAKTENWKYCSKIIFKYVNNIVRPIFNFFSAWTVMNSVATVLVVPWNTWSEEKKKSGKTQLWIQRKTLNPNGTYIFTRFSLWSLSFIFTTFSPSFEVRVSF